MLLLIKKEFVSRAQVFEDRPPDPGTQHILYRLKTLTVVAIGCEVTSFVDFFPCGVTVVSGGYNTIYTGFRSLVTLTTCMSR